MKNFTLYVVQENQENQKKPVPTTSYQIIMFSASALMAAKYNGHCMKHLQKADQKMSEIDCEKLHSELATNSSGGRYRDNNLKVYKENCVSYINRIGQAVSVNVLGIANAKNEENGV